MSVEELVKFLHVLSAIAWLGGGIGLHVLTVRVERAHDPVLFGALGRQMNAMGNFYFAPAAIATLLFGIITVIVGDWSFTQPFVIIGFVGVVVSIILGAGVQGRAAKELEQVATVQPVDTTRMEALQRRINTVSLVDIGLLIVVVWAMVTKPDF